MKNNMNHIMFIFLLLPILQSIFTAALEENIYSDGDVITVSLKNYTNSSAPEVVMFKLQYNSHITVKIAEIPTFINFIVLQLHTYTFPITLLYDAAITDINHVNGTNIGLVNFKTASGITNYVHNFNNLTVSSMIAVVGYGNENPIPGGCAMEAQTKIAPYLNLNITSAMVSVSGGPSSLSTNSCDLSNGIAYDFYHMFLPQWDLTEETYFLSLIKMMTYDELLKHSSLASEPATGSLMKRTFSRYDGVGRIFTVVAKSANGGLSVYIPAFTNSCEPLKNHCSIMITNFVTIELSILTFFGLFLCWRGHKYFTLNLFLTSAIFGGVISYILLVRNYTLDLDYILFATPIGVVFGMIWIFIWWLVHKPILSICIPIFTACFVITSFAFSFYYFPIFESDVNYWGMYFSITLVLFFVALISSHTSIILSTCIIGSFITLSKFSILFGSSIPYIFINVIRRATIDGFNVANMEVPYEFPDIALLIVAASLMTFGTISQMKHSSGRPPFPPIPTVLRQDELTSLISDNTNHPTYTTPEEVPPVIVPC